MTETRTAHINIVHLSDPDGWPYRVERTNEHGNRLGYVNCANASEVARAVARRKNTYPSATVAECDEDGAPVHNPLLRKLAAADDGPTGSDGADGDAGEAADYAILNATTGALLISIFDEAGVTDYLTNRAGNSGDYEVLATGGRRWRGDLWLAEHTTDADVMGHAAPDIVVHEQAVDDVLPIGARVVVDYMGAPGYIPRGRRNGVVTGYAGDYYVVEIEGVNLPKRYKRDALTVATGAKADAA